MRNVLCKQVLPLVVVVALEVEQVAEVDELDQLLVLLLAHGLVLVRQSHEVSHSRARLHYQYVGRLDVGVSEVVGVELGDALDHLLGDARHLVLVEAVLEQKLLVESPALHVAKKKNFKALFVLLLHQVEVQLVLEDVLDPAGSLNQLLYRKSLSLLLFKIEKKFTKFTITCTYNCFELEVVLVRLLVRVPELDLPQDLQQEVGACGLSLDLQ